MNVEGFNEIDFGLDLSPKSLKNKKLVLIRHPKNLDIAEVLDGRKFKIPHPGEASEPLLDSVSTGTHNINYKLFVDKDPMHSTFRPIIKGGKMGPTFDASMSIVQFVETGNNSDAPTTPAITAYSKVPRVRGLKPCLLPLGSDISQEDINVRVSNIDGSLSAGDDNSSGTVRADLISPKDKKKKKRKSEAVEVAETPTSSTSETPSKHKKEKKSKHK